MIRRQGDVWWDSFRDREQLARRREELLGYFGRWTWHLWATVTFSRPTSRSAAGPRVIRCLAGPSLLWMTRAALLAWEPHQDMRRWHVHGLIATTWRTPCDVRIHPTRNSLVSTQPSVEVWRRYRDCFERSCGFSRVYPVEKPTPALVSYLTKYLFKSVDSGRHSGHQKYLTRAQRDRTPTLAGDDDADNWTLWTPG